MRKAKVESWVCGDCSADVDTESLFAWCDGCSKVLCVTCLDVAVSCVRCDTLVCRHCLLRFFGVDCAGGCGEALHTDCAQALSHPLCEGCGRQAEALWA